MAKYDNDALLAELVDDLTPVKVQKRATGWLLVGGATFAAALAVIAWTGRLTSPSPLFMLANGLLLLLGIAASASAIAMAAPRVGAHHDGPRWALAMASVLPLAALALLPWGSGQIEAAIDVAHGWHCMTASFAAAALTALALTLWLRHGAPVSPQTGGLFAGIGAGALGTVAYGLTCSLDGIHHLGIWHVLPVVLWALVGRFGIARAIRW